MNEVKKINQELNKVQILQAEHLIIIQMKKWGKHTGDSVRSKIIVSRLVSKNAIKIKRNLDALCRFS